MNIQQLTKILIDSGIEPNEAKVEMKMLLEHYCNYTELDKMRGKELPEGDLLLIEEKVRYRAETKTPIQYITGKAWFMGEYFNVTPDVLIPRDETEILVREAINVIEKNDCSTVLDVGTGSGCIACTIAKKTNATVLGVDISSDALRVALDNVTALGINNKAVFRKSDLFSKIHDNENFDIIVSNPPYIPENVQLQDEVLHEPQMALYAKENGLEFYRKITEEAPKYLNNRGHLLFELGEGEASSVKSFMQKNFAEIRIIKDMAGIERVIVGKLAK
jgi:release factor glutamine methyltransferase